MLPTLHVHRRHIWNLLGDKCTWKLVKENCICNYGGGIKRLMLHSGVQSRDPLYVKKELKF